MDIRTGRETLVASGHTTHSEGPVPATSAHDACITGCRSDGIGRRLVSVQAIPVGTPLLDVAAHVINAQFVGCLGSHGMGYIIGVALVPAYLFKVITARIHIAPAPVSSTGGKLPLGFGDQAEGLTRLLIELGAERHAVGIGHRCSSPRASPREQGSPMA